MKAYFRCINKKAQNSSQVWNHKLAKCSLGMNCLKLMIRQNFRHFEKKVILETHFSTPKNSNKEHILEQETPIVD